MAGIRSNCERVWAVKRLSDVGIVYQAPVRRIDRKRDGRTLAFTTGRRTVQLGGAGINALVRILSDVGETGGRVNRRRVRVGRLPA